MLNLDVVKEIEIKAEELGVLNEYSNVRGVIAKEYINSPVKIYESELYTIAKLEYVIGTIYSVHFKTKLMTEIIRNFVLGVFLDAKEAFEYKYTELPQKILDNLVKITYNKIISNHIEFEKEIKRTYFEKTFK